MHLGAIPIASLIGAIPIASLMGAIPIASLRVLGTSPLSDPETFDEIIESHRARDADEMS